MQKRHPRGLFIIGTGRTGTHLLTSIMREFSNVKAINNGKEDPDYLRELVRRELDGLPLGGRLEAALASRIKPSRRRYYLDQHHPHLWFKEHLANVYPESVFIWPHRHVLQVVASMMEKTHITRWFEEAKARRSQIAFPSRFLGIRDPNELDLPIHVLCTRRVISHYEEATRLSLSTPNTYKIEFEILVKDPAEALRASLDPGVLQSLGRLRSIPTIDQNVTKKFEAVLSPTQQEEIMLEFNRDRQPLPD